MTTRRETGRETMIRRSDPMVRSSEQIPGPSSQADNGLIIMKMSQQHLIMMMLTMMRRSEQLIIFLNVLTG